MRRRVDTLLAIAAWAIAATAQVSVDYSATVVASATNDRLAPYYVSSNVGGRFTQGGMALLGLEAHHAMDSTKRWSWAAGVEVWGGVSQKTAYDRYEPVTGAIVDNFQRPAALWLQQAYFTGKYRGSTVTIGQRERSSLIVGRNSSGDLTRSTNARPLPGLEMNFIDYQDIKFTRGWVQAMLELSFYHNTDDSWLRNHYVGRGGFLTTNYWMSYKALFLRTKPTQPVVATLGIHASCQFGGTTSSYDLHGNLTSKEHNKCDFKTFLLSIIPSGESTGTADDFCAGNHIGSVDLAVDWHIGNTGKTLRAYFQNPFEDGSSLGKLNGFDGLYGIEYRGADNALVSNAVVEYIDLTNQSGPIHWAPADKESTQVTHQATGADDYYNNYTFNGYQTAGMSIGSPMVTSPIWNRDGYMHFRDNLMRGFHFAVEGCLSGPWRYRAMVGYRRVWGTPFMPRVSSLHSTSAMIEASYTPPAMRGFSARAQLAIDRGDLLGNRVGGLLSLTYSGNLTFKR